MLFYQTLEVELKDSFDKIVRALFDCGSMPNFILEACVKRHCLNHRNVSIPIKGQIITL